MTSSDALDRVLQLRSNADYRGARELANAEAPTGGEGGPRPVQLLIELGRLDEEFADYPAAASALARAAELAGALEAAEERDVLRARALAGLAAVRRAEGRSNESDPLLADAVALIEPHIGAAPVPSVRVLVEAGARQAELAEHHAAQALFEQAVAAAGAADAGPERDGAQAQ
ncbi:MAG TPA: hypothetical protein VML96_12310, partial [Egibacteraceae bacterium]|nr:hypothetical protein [Egibacteraceae bacterium]